MPQATENITLEDMRYCVRREVGRRKRVYQGLVARDQMTPEDAKWEIDYMQEVQNLLERLLEKQLALL